VARVREPATLEVDGAAGGSGATADDTVDPETGVRKGGDLFRGPDVTDGGSGKLELFPVSVADDRGGFVVNYPVLGGLADEKVDLSGPENVDLVDVLWVWCAKDTEVEGFNKVVGEVGGR
jgi:hypothetical protein